MNMNQSTPATYLQPRGRASLRRLLPTTHQIPLTMPQEGSLAELLAIDGAHDNELTGPVLVATTTPAADGSCCKQGISPQACDHPT